MQPNRKILQVPEKLKSGLIGSGGHLINYIRSATKSDIKIHNPAPGENFATVVITGNVAMAEDMINEQLIGLQTHPTDVEWQPRYVDVPQFLVPLVIGPKGKKLHELMEKSGCLIKFIPAQEIDPTADPEKQICRVKGPEDKLAYGVQLVEEQIVLARRYHTKRSMQQQPHQQGGQVDSMPGWGFNTHQNAGWRADHPGGDGMHIRNWDGMQTMG